MRGDATRNSSCSATTNSQNGLSKRIQLGRAVSHLINSRAFYLLPSIQLIELHYQPALTRCYPRKSSSKRALQRLTHIRPLSKPTPVGRNWQCDPLHAAHAMHASNIPNIQTSDRGFVSGAVALLLSLSLLGCIRRNGFVEIISVILWKRFDLAAEQGSAYDSRVPLALLLRDMVFS